MESRLRALGGASGYFGWPLANARAPIIDFIVRAHWSRVECLLCVCILPCNVNGHNTTSRRCNVVDSTTTTLMTTTTKTARARTRVITSFNPSCTATTAAQRPMNILSRKCSQQECWLQCQKKTLNVAACVHRTRALAHGDIFNQ